MQSPSDDRPLAGPEPEPSGRRLIKRLSAPGKEADFSASRQADSREALREALAHDVVENPQAPFDQDTADHMLLRADNILERLGAEGEDAKFSSIEEAMMEAFVVTDGSRPAIYVRDGTIDLADPKLRHYADMSRDGLTRIERVIASTGRVVRNGDIGDSTVYGTAWRVGERYMATAQHVIEFMAHRVGDEWLLKSGFTVDFSVEADRPGDPNLQIPVEAIEVPSPDVIGGLMIRTNLDAAVLRLAPSPHMPPPLDLSDDLAVLASDSELFTVGHPRKLEGSWIAEREEDANEARVFRGVLEELVGTKFGVKRFSPGRVELEVGQVDGDERTRIFSHDATTLGGNSGSPVMRLDGGEERAVGLHYAGRFRLRNYAHAVPKIREHLLVPEAVG